MTTEAINPPTIKMNDVTYVREDIQNAKPGKRAVIVVDRGWVFAGDVEDVDGRIKLTRAVNVRRWDGVGFEGMLKDPKSSKVHIKEVPPVDMPRDAELFRVPVADDWGL